MEFLQRGTSLAMYNCAVRSFSLRPRFKTVALFTRGREQTNTLKVAVRASLCETRPAFFDIFPRGASVPALVFVVAVDQYGNASALSNILTLNGF